MANHNDYFDGRSPLKVIAQGDLASLRETWRCLDVLSIEEVRRQCVIVAAADAGDRDLQDLLDATLLDLDLDAIEPCAQQAQKILEKIKPWAGSRHASGAWYRTYPIAALGGLTAERLVAEGRTAEVIQYLEHIREGGFT